MYYKNIALKLTRSSI